MYILHIYNTYNYIYSRCKYANRQIDWFITFPLN